MGRTPHGVQDAQNGRWVLNNMIQTSHSLSIEFRLKEKEYGDLQSVLRLVPPQVMEGAKRAMDRAEEAWVNARFSEWRIFCQAMEAAAERILLPAVPFTMLSSV